VFRNTNGTLPLFAVACLAYPFNPKGLASRAIRNRCPQAYGASSLSVMKLNIFARSIGVSGTSGFTPDFFVRVLSEMG
jgi:hypothetical protein